MMINRLKALFVPLLITVAVSVAGNAVPQLLTGSFSVAWLGVGVTAVAILIFFINLYRFTTPRTTATLPGWTTAVVIGGVLALAGQLLPNRSQSALISAAILVVGWFLYVYWYSRLERPSDTPLAVGKRLPDFVVEDEAGNKIYSRDWQGQPTLLMFYRGNWCPLCMAQIREVAANYRELARRGVQVVLISPQSQAKTSRLAGRFDVPLHFLVDAGNRAARQLKLDHAHGLPTGLELLGYDSETVLPTVLLLDENGRVLHLEETDNYRLRPDPALFLQILDATQPLVHEAGIN